MVAHFHHPLARKLAAGFGAFVLADLIVGLTAFSVISLATLWYFSLSWIRLAQLSEVHHLAFGSSWQLTLAGIGACVALPLLAATVLLAIRAASLPRRAYELGR